MESGCQHYFKRQILGNCPVREWIINVVLCTLANLPVNDSILRLKISGIDEKLKQGSRLH
eukprot:445161-Amphidinium_carterae.1